jgi:hypothetical protein
MLKLIIGGIIGAFIGWNVPQPPWAKKVTDTIKEKLKS